MMALILALSSGWVSSPELTFQWAKLAGSFLSSWYLSRIRGQDGREEDTVLALHVVEVADRFRDWAFRLEWRTDRLEGRFLQRLLNRRART
ncbi:hypothetical protein HYQ46_010612 [Verticillium longisporum]|nr:hypothetical protein HYQ46_010612 [Verticillium longisporum]